MGRQNWERVQELIGDILIKKNDPLLNDWVKDHIKKQKKVVNGLKNAKADYNAEKIDIEEKLLQELTNLSSSKGG